MHLGWAAVCSIIGAPIGAYYGWTFPDPETINIMQAGAAAAGLVIGAVAGALVGVLIAFGLIVFWIGLGLYLAYLLLRFLFSP